MWFNMGFPGGSDSKESACNAGDLGSIPGMERSPEGGHINPLQYSCLRNPMDREQRSLVSYRVRYGWATKHSTLFNIHSSWEKTAFKSCDVAWHWLPLLVAVCSNLFYLNLCDMQSPKWKTKIERLYNLLHSIYHTFKLFLKP